MLLHFAFSFYRYKTNPEIHIDFMCLVNMFLLILFSQWTENRFGIPFAALRLLHFFSANDILMYLL